MRGLLEFDPSELVDENRGTVGGVRFSNLALRRPRRLAGRLGGYRTDGSLIHDAHGTMDGQAGVLRTTVVRPFGNVRNPSVLAAITAREIADGKDFGTGFIHPASWMDPERVIRELVERGNEVSTQWKPMRSTP